MHIFESVQSTDGGCCGPAASYMQLTTHERLRAQFAVWYLLLVLSRKGIQGYWSPLLVARATDNLWLAVCFGGCVVRPAPSASQSARCRLTLEYTAPHAVHAACACR